MSPRCPRASRRRSDLHVPACRLGEGASRGIGRAIAKELGRTHRVLVGETDAEKVAEVVAELPDAQPFIGDLTDADVVASLSAGVEQLDILVHSDGLASYVSVEDAALRQWR